MTHMEREAREAPEAVQRFLERNDAALADLGRRLRITNPPFILTSARGSSDHAAGYLKYLSEILLGVPCASVGASVASIYGARLRARSALAVTISQSGQSPDILALQQEARGAGALSVAIVNAEDSPAGQNADVCLPLYAGPEKSVAATKTVIVSMAAGAALVAHWLADGAMQSAISSLPELLHEAMKGRWIEFSDKLAGVDSLYVLGRGPSLPIASETALKLKETCAIHAEAHSAAEVMHGPLELVAKDFPVLVLAQNDQSLSSTVAALERLKLARACVLACGAFGHLTPRSSQPLLDPLVMLASVYVATEHLARVRGRDPDAPRMLRKVTETV
jgi:glucosamine--fructose-6-phosphate aminotransferase (isomerizing)